MNKKIAVAFLMGSLLMTNTKTMNVYGEEKANKFLPIEISTDISVYSAYIWRGFKLDGDPVIQPGIYISGYGVTLSAWGDFAYDTNDYVPDELDYTIDYTYKLDKISLSVGHIYYVYSSSGTGTHSKEFYVGTGLDIPLSPTLIWYHDYGKEESGGGDGDYIELASSYSIPLGRSSISLDLSGHVGYNDALFIRGKGGDAALGMGFTIPLGEKLTLTPNINYSMPFGDLEDANDGGEDNEFYGGFTLAYSF